MTDKAPHYIDDQDTSPWVVAYTELVVGVGFTSLFAIYDEFVFCYAPLHIIKLDPKFFMAIEVPLDSRAKIGEFMVLLAVIESTQSSSLLNLWLERSFRAADYHPDQVDE